MLWKQLSQLLLCDNILPQTIDLSLLCYHFLYMYMNLYVINKTTS